MATMVVNVKQPENYKIELNTETGRFFATHDGSSLGYSETLEGAKTLVRKHATGSEKVAKRSDLDLRGLLVTVRGARTTAKRVTLKGMDARSGLWRYVWHRGGSSDTTTTDKAETNYFIPLGACDLALTDDVDTLVDQFCALSKARDEAAHRLTVKCSTQGFKLQDAGYGKPSPETVLGAEETVKSRANAALANRPKEA